MPGTRALDSLLDSYSASVWLDDEGEDTPVGGGVPDPSQRHWRHPSEVAAELAALAPSEPAATKQASGWPMIWPFGALLGSISVCAVAIVAVVVSGFGDKPLTVGTYQAGAPSGTDDLASTSQRALSNDRTDDPAVVQGDNRTGNQSVSERSPTQPDSDQLRPATTIGVSSENDTTTTVVDDADREALALATETSSADAPATQTSQSFDEQMAFESALEQVPKLFAEPDRDSPLLGSYVVGEGFVLTSNANLDQADYAVISNADSWVVLQPMFEASGVAVLVPTGGQSLAGMTPQIETNVEPAQLGQPVSVGVTDQTVASGLVGTITVAGNLLVTDIEYHPSLAGAPLYNSAGEVLGVVSAPSSGSNATGASSVVAISVANAVAIAQSYLSSESVTIAMLGDLEVEASISGVFVRDVPLVSTSTAPIDKTNWFEVGDKIDSCDGLPISSMIDLIAGATRIFPGATIVCTVTRDDSEFLVRHPVGTLDS